MGKGERPEEVLMAGVVVMMWGRGGRGHWRGSELRVERQSLVKEWQVQGSIWRDAGARWQTEAWATLHGRKMTSGETHSSSYTSSTVAPSFLHRCPYSRALGPPRWAEPTEFIREWQGATLTFARGCCRSLAGGCSGVVCSDGCVAWARWHAAAAEAEIPDQTSDCLGASWLRHCIPQALQTGTRLVVNPLLDGTAPPQVQPPICLCNIQDIHPHSYWSWLQLRLLRYDEMVPVGQAESLLLVSIYLNIHCRIFRRVRLKYLESIMSFGAFKESCHQLSEGRTALTLDHIPLQLHSSNRWLCFC